MIHHITHSMLKAMRNKDRSETEYVHTTQKKNAAFKFGNETISHAYQKIRESAAETKFHEQLLII